jgi:hypothetical protein
LQHILASLLDPARNAATVQRPECLQRPLNEENQRALQNIRLICALSFH